jgi:hypothetical protein
LTLAPDELLDSGHGLRHDVGDDYYSRNSL